MLVRISKTMSAAALAATFCASMWAQATPAPEKKVKDQGEYDLYNSITKETDAKKRLDFLNTWKEKYAETDYKDERMILFLQTYIQLAQSPKIMETAKQILVTNPKDFTSLFYITSLTPTLNDTGAGALETGEKAAQGVLANLDTVFVASKKPAATSDADWTKARTDAEVAAHSTLAWIAAARKQGDVAQQEYKKVLALSPGAGSVAYALALSIQSEKKVERHPEMLFYYARAASTDGPGALTPENRTKLDSFVAHAYTNYHGSAAGLEELKALAKTNALPPADFKIVSATEIAGEKAKQEAEVAKNNPQLAIWTTLKAALTAADGQQYYETGVKGAGLPKLRGKLVSQSPALKPKTLVVALSDDTTAEVTLNLNAPLAGKAEPGTVLQFEGVPTGFTQSPFMLMMDLEKEKLTGWPAQAAPPAHRPAARRTSSKKK